MKIKKIVKSISSGKFKFPALLFVAIEKVFPYHREIHLPKRIKKKARRKIGKKEKRKRMETHYDALNK